MTTTFKIGDRCMFLVEDRPGAVPQWATGTIVAREANPYVGFRVRRDASSLVYFIAEEEVRSL